MIQVKQIQVLGATVNSVQISDITVDLDKSAHFDATVFDTSGAPILVKNISLSGSEYDAWGSNDNYITNITLTKLGLVGV